MDIPYNYLFFILLTINISILLHKLITHIYHSRLISTLSTDIVLVIIINKDLRMSKGKTIAQIAHLISMVHKRCPFVSEWTRCGEAKVVLKASYDEMRSVVRRVRAESGIMVSSVYDAGRTQVPAGSNTVVGIGPWNKAEIAVFTKDLKMY